MPRSILLSSLALAAGLAVTLPAPASADGGWLGVSLQAVDDDLRDALDLDRREGVLIADVVPGSPADDAGLEDGDVLLEVDGREMTSERRLRRAIDRHDPDDEVEILLLRDGERVRVTATLGEREGPVRWESRGGRPGHPGRSWSFSWPHHGPRHFESLPGPGDLGSLGRLGRFFARPRLGVETRKLDEDLAGYFDVDAGEGVLVLSVIEDTPAAEVGLRAGDVILSVDGDAIDSPGELRDALLAHEGDIVELSVRRHEETLTVSVELDQPAPGSFFGRGLRTSELDPGEAEALREELARMREELEELRQEIERLDER